MLTTCLLGALVGYITAMLLWHQTMALLRSRWDWQDLLRMLDPVAMGNVARLALEYSNPEHTMLHTMGDESWQTIGGVAGLLRLRRNAEVLLTLAARLDQLAPRADGSTVLEMRSQGMALRSAVTTILVSRCLSRLMTHESMCVQQVAALYLQMVEALTLLFEMNGSEGCRIALDTWLWDPPPRTSSPW